MDGIEREWVGEHVECGGDGGWMDRGEERVADGS
jgi:hypothetical protein